MKHKITAAPVVLTQTSPGLPARGVLCCPRGECLLQVLCQHVAGPTPWTRSVAGCLQEAAVTLLSGGAAVAPRSEAWPGELGQFG